MGIKDILITALKESLEKLGITTIDPLIQISADVSRGDYSTPVALAAAKLLHTSPMHAAEQLKHLLEEAQLPGVANITLAPPGFLNITIESSYVITRLKHLLMSNFTLNEKNQARRTVVLEYSSPNIAKPFTIGHLRSTIIGDAVANLLEATGVTVYRDNHVGDWGTQFGKQLYAIKEWGNEAKLDQSDRPMKELVDLYIRFHEEATVHPEIEEAAREWFKKLENGDSEALRLWKKCIEWSWKEFEAIYQTLDVRFTENKGRGYGEAYFSGKMQIVIDELTQKNLLKESEGARVIFFPNDKYPPLLILKKDGATLYATRDLATDKFRIEKYGTAITIINEVGSEQSLYFQQLFETEHLLGWFTPEQRIHIKHGLYRFKDGKMSTRKGNVIWLEDVLGEAEERALRLLMTEGQGVAGEHTLTEEEKQTLSRVVGIGALKWNDLKRTSQQDIVFDWDDILRMQGNSGPYIQYTFARTQSLLRKAKGKNEYALDNKKMQSYVKEEEMLLKKLSHFPEVIAQSASEYAPHILCTYLFELAQLFNQFYQKCPILKEEQRIKDLRLFLTDATGQVLKKGLGLLGIATPSVM